MTAKTNSLNRTEQYETSNHYELISVNKTAVKGLKLNRFYPSSHLITNSRFANTSNNIAYLANGSVWIINAKTKKKQLIYSGVKRANALAWSNDDRLLAVGDDSIIVLIEVETRRIIQHLSGHNSWINDLIFLRSEITTLVSASADGKVIHWELNKKVISKTIAEFNGPSVSIAYEHHSDTLHAASSYNELATINLKTLQEIERTLYENYGDYSNSYLACSKSFLAFATGSLIDIKVAFDHSIEQVEIEAHNEPICGLAFSPDERLMVSKSLDGSVKFWDTDRWECIYSLVENNSKTLPIHINFSRDGNYLLTRANFDKAIRVWQIDTAGILSNVSAIAQVRYTTAKIVLVGDSGVGKTGLGWRLSQGEFKEHESTHGQQFWIVDDLKATRTDGTECEAVLWDLAGQPDYRLVHSLFLDKVDLALILFDPTLRENPLSSAIFWLNQLQMDQAKNCPAILIGSRVDRGTATLSVTELNAFAQANGFIGGYLATSASTNEGLNKLLQKIKDLIPWESFSATITTLTFKEIKSFILSLKESNKAKTTLVTYQQLHSQIQEIRPDLVFELSELKSAVNHLENHGYVTIIQSSKQETFVLLFPDLIINLASSIILEARKNAKGLGVLDENKLLEGEFLFPELENLTNREQKIILDATTSLFLKKAICFREQFNSDSLLVFPSLINEKKPNSPNQSLTEGASYVVTGSIENVYASLVVKLGYTNTFTRQNLWQNQAEYQLNDKEVCGFQQNTDKEAEVEFTLYHIDQVSDHTKQFFQILFERFLIRRDISVRRYMPVICNKCKEQVFRNVIIKRLESGRDFCFCNECGDKISIEHAVENLTHLAFDKSVDVQKQIAEKRTVFETSMIKVKGLLNKLNQQLNPKIFICYAWGNKEHENWVHRFAKDLKNASIAVLLDRWSNMPGSSITGFVDEIMDVDYVLPIGTKLFKDKYTSKTLDSVLKAEQTLVNTRLRRKSQFGDSVIPILLEGSQIDAFTPLLQDIVFIDFTREEDYFSQLMNLIGQIHNISLDDGYLEIVENFEISKAFSF